MRRTPRRVRWPVRETLGDVAWCAALLVAATFIIYAILSTVALSDPTIGT